jgi:hypothetical protein
VIQSGSGILLSQPPIDVDDPTFITILISQKQFPNVVESNWQPPRSIEDSWDSIAQWIKKVGYIE